MNYSGILISFQHDAMDAALEAIRQLPQVEVFQVDTDGRRAIAVIEAETTGAEVSVFESIQKVSGVVDVSLVNHFFSEEELAHPNANA